MSRSSLQKRTPLVHDEEQPEEPLAQVPLPSRQLPGAAIQVETEQLSGTNGLQKKRRYGTVSFLCQRRGRYNDVPSREQSSFLPGSCPVER